MRSSPTSFSLSFLAALLFLRCVDKRPIIILLFLMASCFAFSFCSVFLSSYLLRPFTWVFVLLCPLVLCIWKHSGRDFREATAAHSPFIFLSHGPKASSLYSHGVMFCLLFLFCVPLSLDSFSAFSTIRFALTLLWYPLSASLELLCAAPVLVPSLDSFFALSLGY